MIIEEIELLGKKVDSLWEKGKDKIPFSKIATAVLQESQIHSRFSFEEFLHELWQKKELPKQLSLYNSFGQPPLTLYQGKDFLIDIYFWVTPDISIHSHSFQGAFTVLQGLSLQSHYRFITNENLNDRVLIGNLVLQKTKLIQVGQVEEILAGPEFIHQVWHLGYPTVSLAIRTFGPEGKQYSYLKPHLAFYSHTALSPTIQKQMDTLLMLRRIHQPEESHLLQLATSLNPDEALALLSSYGTSTGDLALIEKVIANLPPLEKWASPFLTSLTHHYETAFDMVEIPDLGERLLLAILNISTTREQSENLFQMVFPHQNFEENALKWFRSLLEKKTLRFEFNQTALDVFTYLFQGYNEDQICEKLSEKYDVQNNDDFQSDIRQFLNQLTSCDLLKPLLPKGRQPSISKSTDELFLPPLTPLLKRPAEPYVSSNAIVVADQESTNFFNVKGYWILRNVIEVQTLNIFFNYFFFREKNSMDFSSDSQVEGSKNCYADPLCESLLLELQPHLEKVTGKALLPTYSYIRIYGPGQVLEKHRDRPSCEISATLTIGYEATTLWPLFVESNGQKDKIELDKGDLLIYKGCEVFHWREKFEGKFWLQIFLHFVDKNGKFAEWQYDKRKGLGENLDFRASVQRVR